MRGPGSEGRQRGAVHVLVSGKKPPRSVQRMKQLCVALDPETMVEIDKAAKAAKLTRSEWVRERLTWALMDQGALS